VLLPLIDLSSVSAENHEGREDPELLKTLAIVVPVAILKLLVKDPEAACQAFDADASSVSLVWNKKTREMVAAVLKDEADKVQTIVEERAGRMPTW
jgi:hypothetical protein